MGHSCHEPASSAPEALRHTWDAGGTRSERALHAAKGCAAAPVRAWKTKRYWPGATGPTNTVSSTCEAGQEAVQNAESSGLGVAHTPCPAPAQQDKKQCGIDRAMRLKCCALSWWRGGAAAPQAHAASRCGLRARAWAHSPCDLGLHGPLRRSAAPTWSYFSLSALPTYVNRHSRSA